MGKVCYKFQFNFCKKMSLCCCCPCAETLPEGRRHILKRVDKSDPEGPFAQSTPSSKSHSCSDDLNLVTGNLSLGLPSPATLGPSLHQRLPGFLQEPLSCFCFLPSPPKQKPRSPHSPFCSFLGPHLRYMKFPG